MLCQSTIRSYFINAQIYSVDHPKHSDPLSTKKISPSSISSVHLFQKKEPFPIPSHLINSLNPILLEALFENQDFAQTIGDGLSKFTDAEPFVLDVLDSQKCSEK